MVKDFIKPNDTKINFANKTLRDRPSWHTYFLNIAEVVATRSHDAETQVGAIIVSPTHRIIATGYNGFPANCDDDLLPNLRPDKYPFVIHAEVNAIVSAKQDLSGCMIYVTHSPCHDCAKTIIASGIKKVIFRQIYKNADTDFILNFLKTFQVESTLVNE
jgi:dCMP deaminase